MPSILVVERDPNYAERINAALSAEGWSVRVVPAVELALQAGSAEKPDLIVAGADLPGFEVLVFSFSRTSGGPGVIGLVPESGLGGGPDGADGHLAKPFTDQQVVLAVRQALLSGRPAAAPAPPAREQKLTSHDIFGDVLAEVEGDEAPGFGAPAPSPVPAPPPPRPLAVPAPVAASAAPAPPPRPAPAPPRADDEMQRRLEKTLSGMLNPEPRPRPAAPAAPPQAAAPPPPRRPETAADKVDALLSKTLSNLELDLGRTKTGVRPPVPAAPAAPAPPPVAAAPVAPPPHPAAAPPPPARLPLQPQAAQPAPVAPPQEGTGVRKAKVVGDFDFSELEDLIRPATVAPRPAAPPVAPATPAPEPARAAFTPAPQPLPLTPPEPPPAPAPVPRPSPAAPASVLTDVAATQRIPVFADEGDGSGERFGQYTLLDRIAVGGMAEVWKARMRGVEGFQKTVAIKKILPHMTDNAEFVGMFIDEAKLAAQLSHPNIVHIYDLGKIGRDYYIAMEYVEGKDLRSLLNAARRRGMGLPLGLALLIAARVASALDYAHRRRDDDHREIGLVHRDISPQNVLLTLEGDVKLCDFGIAKAVSKASHTLVGALKGKLQYMSPEQAWGRPVDSRSDLFSLGAVLFEMITGERLFPGDSEMSVLESVRQGKTRTPRQIDPSVPVEVDEIVARAIAIDPEERFQTAGEMKQRLEAALAALKPSPGPTDLSAFIHRALEPAPAASFESPMAAPAAPAQPSWPAAGPAPAEAPAPAAPFPAGPEQPVEAVAPLGEVAVEEGEGGRKSRTLLYAAIAALILVAVLTFIFLNNRRKAPRQAPPSPGAAQPAAAAPALLPAAQPAPAEATTTDFAPAAQDTAAEMDLQAIVDEQLAAREKELRRQLEQKQRELEKQVADARAAAQPPPAAAQAPVAPSPFQPAPAERPADPEPSAPPPVASDPPQQREPEPPPPEPASPRERPEPQPEPTPRVRAGELVQPGPGVVVPQLVSFPKPEYPPMARNLRVEGIVVVSVLVDENGQVQDARLAEPIRQKVGLNEAALASAKAARYKPATKEGVRVKMWTRLRIPFKL